VRLEAVGRAPEGFERAAKCAAQFLGARGYRGTRGTSEERVFHRGSCFGSLTGISPRRWTVRLSVSVLPSSRVAIAFDINDTFQTVTEGERAFWADEAAGLLAAIEGRPFPRAPSGSRAAAAARALGPALLAIVLISALGGALWVVAQLLLLVPGLERPPDFARDWDWAFLLWELAHKSVVEWMLLGAIFGAAVGLRALASDPDSLSQALGGPVQDGEALVVGSLEGSGGAEARKGIVVAFDRDFASKRDVAGRLLEDRLWEAASVRVVVHPRAAERAIAESLATKQLLIAGLRVDRSLFACEPFEEPAGVAGHIIEQRSAPPQTRTAAGVQTTAGSRWRDVLLCVVGYTLKAVAGGSFAALGAVMAWDALAIGREFGGTDTRVVVSLIVEGKAQVGGASAYEISSLFGRRDFRVHGRIADTNEPAEVAVPEEDYAAITPRQKLDVYRLRGPQPSFVARAKYKHISPLVRLPGIAFHWALFVGCFLIGLGVKVIFEPSVDRRE
jgi:hypothetical protein